MKDNNSGSIADFVNMANPGAKPAPTQTPPAPTVEKPAPNISMNLFNKVSPGIQPLFVPKQETYGIAADQGTSNTASFILKYSPLAGTEPTKDGVNALVTNKYEEKKAQTYDVIKRSFASPDGIPIDTKIKAATAVVQGGIPADSPGEAFKRENFPQSLSTIDNSVDYQLNKETHSNDVVQNLGYKTEDTKLDDVLHEPNSEITKELLSAIASHLPKIDTEQMSGVANFLANSPLINPVKRAEKVWELVAGADNAIASAIKNKTLDTLGLPRDANLKDMVEYLSFLPKNANAEIDVNNAVGIVFSKDTLEGRIQKLKRWDSEFRNKYGDEGYWQMASFMAKEGIVDGAALALALKNKNIAKNLVSKTGDAIYARIVKALGRSAVMGLAGTGVQQSMDRYLGFNTPTTTELGTRIGGAFVGEGVSKVVGSAIHGIIGAGNRAVRSGLNLFTDEGAKVSSTPDEVIQSVIANVAPLKKGTVQTPADIASQIALEAQGEGSKRILRDTSQEVKNAAINGKIGQLGHIFNRTESEVETDMWIKEKATAENITTTPRTLKTDVLIQGVGNRLVGENIARQSEVDKVLHYYFDANDGTLAKRTGAFKGDTSFVNFKESLSEPRNYIGDMADNLFDSDMQKNMYRSAILEAQKAAYKDLKEKPMNALFKVREDMEELTRNNPWYIVTPESLEAKGLSPDQIDAYFALGKVTDFAAIHAENMALKNAKEMGVKQLANGDLVKPIAKVSDHIMSVKVIKGKDPHLTREVFISDMKDVYRINGYKPNFVPDRAETPPYLIGIMDTSTGKIESPIAGRTMGETKSKVSQLEKEFTGTGKVAFFWRTLTNENSMNFGIGQNSVNVLDALGEEGVQNLKEALKNAGVSLQDNHALQLGFDNITYGSIKNRAVAGTRGTGLVDVFGNSWKYKPTDEAITQYLLETASLGMKDFRTEATRKFQKEFAEVLDPNLPWNQEIKNVLGKSDLVQRAKSVQGFLTRNVYKDTEYGQAIRHSIDAWAERMRKSGKGSFVDGMERMPIVNQLFKQTRDGTAFVRQAASLFTFAGNIASFVTQTAPSMAMIAGMKAITNPTHLIKGWKDLMGVAAIGAGMSEQFASKEIKEARRALLKSGIISSFELQDLGNVMYGQSNWLYNKSMYFVQKGEEVNRANIWLTIRAEMIDKLNKGKLANLNGDRFMGSWEKDSTEFSQIVSQKAKQIFLDTTQAGQLKAFSGIGGTIGQFSSPIIKTHTMWFAKDLTPMEKIGATTGLFSLFGIGAVPFVGAGLYLADKTGEIAGGDELSDYTIGTDMAKNIGTHMLDGLQTLTGFSDEEKKFFSTTVKKGLIYSLSGQELALYHKMAIGLWLQQTVEGFEQTPINIPSIQILNKAAQSAGNIAEMMQNLWQAYHMTSDEAYQLGLKTPTEENKVLELHKFMGELLDEFGNAMPGIGKIVDVMNNHPDTRRLLKPNLDRLDDKSYVTRNGKAIQLEAPVDNSERLAIMFGIVPKEVQHNREVLAMEFDRSKQLDKLKQTWLNHYKNANTDMARVRVMREAMMEAHEAERLLMATYQGALNKALGRSNTKMYKAGSLGKSWLKAMQYIDQQKLAGNRTISIGE